MSSIFTKFTISVATVALLAGCGVRGAGSISTGFMDEALAGAPDVDGLLAQIATGRIQLPVCEADGERTLTVTKKDPLWKRARKIRWGERI